MVWISSGRVPFNRLDALEQSESVFLEQHKNIQLSVELQEG